MVDSRLKRCLMSRRESWAVEFKERFNPLETEQALEVLKDIVAIANSGGGAIAIGIKNSGEVSGEDVTAVLNHDHAKYCDLIKKYTMQDFSQLEVVEAELNGKRVAVFLIDEPDYPLVFEKPGTYAIGTGQKNAFSQGTVYFRHGSKSEPGTANDLRRFIQKRMREMNDRLIAGLRKIEVAERGSHIEVLPASVSLSRVRLTDDPKAPEAIAVNRDDICKYRQKEVLMKIKETDPQCPLPTTHDLQAINKVHGILARNEFAWKPQFGSPQYSDLYVEWLVQKIKGDNDFLMKTRGKYRELLTGNTALFR
jgi:hypothetical protein